MRAGEEDQDGKVPQKNDRGGVENGRKSVRRMVEGKEKDELVRRKG
jgi:hypothetical protein